MWTAHYQRWHPRSHAGCALIVMVLVAGCRSRPQPAQQPPATAPAPHAQVRVARPLPAAKVDRPVPRDPPPEAVTVLTLTIYNISVPAGAVSASDDFWKRVNEQALNVQAYDTLHRNGVRVGLGAAGEWAYFRDIVDRHPATTAVTSFTATEARSADLPLRTDVPEQTIFHLTPAGQLQGRSFDRSDNLLAVTFGPAPRKPDHVRVALCPVVRAARARLELTTGGEAREVQVVRPEQMFDCALTVDVPAGGFLVVAPSPDGRWPTSVGAAFLTDDAPAERRERVLLIVPRPVQAERVKT